MLSWKIFSELYNIFISRSYPIFLTHFITEKCNAKCEHCFVDFSKQKEELTLEQIEKIAKKSGKYLRNIDITGGEPFLRKDIFDIVNIWYKNTTVKSITISTNGSFPERIKEFCIKAKENNFPIYFFLSYDFIGEKHSEYRKIKDLHKKVIKSYEIIKEYRFNASFQLTVSPENCDSIFETYQYIKNDLKIKNINCAMARGKKVYACNEQIREKMKNVYLKIQKELDNEYFQGTIGYKNNSLISILLNIKNRIIWKNVYKIFSIQKYISPCLAGKLFGIIYSNGDVAPCEFLNKTFGKLKNFDYNLIQCWHSSKAKKITKEIEEKKCFCTHECALMISFFSCFCNYGQILLQYFKNMRNNEK